MELSSHLKGRDFLRVADWAPADLLDVLDLAAELKVQLSSQRAAHALLPGRSVGLVFEKPSTRTRVSFAVGVAELGATAVPLATGDMQLGRGETIRDTAVVLSRYLDAIVIRTFRQTDVDELADHASIPVVNALTDEYHPCQALADALTIRERFGGFEGVRVAYVGDGNNVCNSLMAVVRSARDRLARSRPLPGSSRTADSVARAREAARRPAPRSSSARPPRSGSRRRRRLHRRLDEHGPGGTRTSGGGAISTATRSTTGSCPGTRARAIVMHDLPAHYGEEITEDVLARPAAPPPGIRPRTASTHRRRCSPSSCAELARRRRCVASRQPDLPQANVLPLKDKLPTRSFPAVTVALIGANVAVWLAYQVPDVDGTIYKLGYQPCEVDGACPTTGLTWPTNAVTSMFAHGGWDHIAVNMLFLWIFGNNVEDALGRVRYLLFYLLGRPCRERPADVGDAPLRHRLRGHDPGDRRERRDRRRARRLPGPLPARPHPLLGLPGLLLPVRAWLYLGVWFLFQLAVGGYAFTHPVEGGGVAYSAHVGGFVFGFLAAKAFMAGRPPKLAMEAALTTFEAHVERALAELPDELRRAMSNVEIVVEDENPEDPDLFGLYTRHPAHGARLGLRRSRCPTRSRSTGSRSRRSSATIPSCSRRRSASPSSTSWLITSASTTIASTSWVGREAGRIRSGP